MTRDTVLGESAQGAGSFRHDYLAHASVVAAISKQRLLVAAAIWLTCLIGAVALAALLTLG